MSAPLAGIACEMQLGGADGEARVDFLVRNAGRRPVTLSWFEPFVTFSIDAEVEGAPARIVAGAYDGGVRRVEEVLEPGAERRITTPITLAFDPAPTLPDPAPPTRWRIVHEPAPTLLRATLALGADRLTCMGRLVPPLG